MRRRASLRAVAVSLPIVVMLACGSTQPATVTQDDGGPDGTSPEGSSPNDASADADLDGPVIDPTDAGGDPPGPDGGPCNRVANTAPAISSHCRAGAPG